MAASVDVSREVVITAKVNELQLQLEEWAKNSAILNPGECIMFSLRIEGMPTVVQDTSGDLWGMHAGKFFDKRRLKKHGVHHSMASRINNAIHNDGAQMMTMRDFLAKYSRRDFRIMPNLAQKSVEEMMRILAEAGMTLKEE